MVVEILLIIMIILCFILYELATMSPLGWHPPHVVDNTDALYLGDQHWQQTMLFFFRFLLFCVHQFAYASVSLCISGSVCNPFQVFKNSFLRCSQWPLVVKVLDFQSRGPVFKATGWLQGWLSLSSFRGRWNEYQEFLGN